MPAGISSPDRDQLHVASELQEDMRMKGRQLQYDFAHMQPAALAQSGPGPKIRSARNPSTEFTASVNLRRVSCILPTLSTVATFN